LLIALIARDKPGHLQTRLDNRDAHVAYLKASGAAIHMAGPLLDDGGDMAGSLIILDLPDIAAARAWADADPYGKAGLFASVDLSPWKKVLG
jgi:uncharacterized protein YciI